jgi:kynurenine formamidase
MNEEQDIRCSPCSVPTANLCAFQQQYHIYDLSYPLDENTILWPGDDGFSLCMNCFRDDEHQFDYAAGTIRTPEHAGTHVDAPYHFKKDGITVERIPLEQLIRNCKVIDIEISCSNERDYLLQTHDITTYENRYGQLEENDIVLIRTGWSRNYLNGAKSYLGYDKTIDGPFDPARFPLSFPGIGKEAAELLVSRKIAAVGIDTGTNSRLCVIDHRRTGLSMCPCGLPSL